MNYKKILHLMKIVTGIYLFILLPLILLLTFGLIQLIIAWITLLAVIVALFREKILDYISKPKIELTISDTSEHFEEAAVHHPITMSIPEQQDYFTENQKWLGIRVENVGLGKARNVELYFIGIASNSIPHFDRYKNIHLHTSWTHKPMIKLLLQDISIRWDIGYISDMGDKDFSFSFYKTPNKLVKIERKSKETSYYIFKILAIAENTEPKSIKVKIKYSGDYKKGISVEKINS